MPIVNGVNHYPPVANDDKRREAYGWWCCFYKPNIGDLARHAVVDVRAALAKTRPDIQFPIENAPASCFHNNARQSIAHNSPKRLTVRAQGSSTADQPVLLSD